MSTKEQIDQWESWVESLVSTRRSLMPNEVVRECDDDLRYRDYRVLAMAMISAANRRDDVPSLTPLELEQARLFNELGFFGRKSIEYYRQLLAFPQLVEA